MALMKSGEIPKDAVILEEHEAMKYVWDLILEWKPASDTWALRNGPTILGFVNAASGLLINSHYRNKLKLGPYGFYSSVIPLTVMPGLLTALFHRHMIPTNILMEQTPTCPICYEVKSATIQTCLGTFYPMVLAPTAALLLANRYNTARVPHLKEGFSVMFNFLRKITRPFNSTIVFLGTVQLVASSAITYFEMRNHYNVRRKLLEIEKKMLDDEHF